MNHFVTGELGLGRGYNPAFDTNQHIFIVKNHKVVGKTTKNLLEFFTCKPYSIKKKLLYKTSSKQ